MADVVSPFSFWAGRRVLLTGHTGFKGAWLALWLERLGAQVFGVSLAPTEPGLWDGIGRPGACLDFTDIRDVAGLERAFAVAKPEIVLHLAAQALVHPSYGNPAETFEINVVGLANVLDACRACETVQAVVNVTSDKCYENREQLWAYRENEPMGGSDPYSASKGCAELVTASYRRSYFSRSGGALLASARAGNVIGGGDWSADRLIPDSVRAFSKGQPVRIRNPLAVRPWQHVLEPLSGYLMLAQALVEKGETFAEGWNLGPVDEDAWPVQKIVETFSAAWGDGAGWEADDRKYAKEAFLLRVDASKAKALLKWGPRLRIGDALVWSAEWYKAVLSGRDAREITLRQIEVYEGLA
jgi:CDP-glucose 4,6-dehydratase